MTSVSHLQPLPRMPSANDIASKGKVVSPLTQMQSFAQAVASSSAPSPRAAPPVPALDFNLFRTNSIYSVDSLSSYAPSRDGSTEDEPDSPTTPKATAQASHIGSRQRAAVSVYIPFAYNEAGPSQHTPRQLHHTGYRSPPPPQPDLGLQYRTSTANSVSRPEARNVTLPIQPKKTDTSADWASIHGEQGSDWGEDEAQFEWLDTDGALEAENGTSSRQISPGKRLSRLKAAVATKDKGEGRKLRKNIVIPKRAAPPPPSESEVGPSTTPTVRSASLPPVPIILSAPLPPIPSPAKLQARPARITDTIPRSGSGDLGPQRLPFAGKKSGYGLPPAPSTGDVFRPSTRANQDQRSNVFLSPTMIPLRDKTSHLNPSKPTPRHLIRNSGMSMQSVAYSFYDIEGAVPTAPKVEGDSIFPNGTYIKVSASTLERENELRERAISDPTPTPRSLPAPVTNDDAPREKPADDFVARGLEARARGDLPKSAWYFWKAAMGGSPTGRMYWGLALRHGWGVGRDDKRAFVELKQACEDALQHGEIDFTRSPGTSRLNHHQRRGITRDLSLGMFEIANCFLGGVGVKKAPDVAVAYLRFAGNMGDLASQEQLGFLLSKGASGIKKDMKEAARWYRMAMAQGSSNTFGLAWVWKDKYMP